MSDDEIKSEFGKGLTYCLGLFLAHAERWQRNSEIKEIMGDDLFENWFNAASDHLYELQILESIPMAICERLRRLQDKALQWGHGFALPKPTQKDMEWALDEAQELLRMIDEHLGIDTIEATWK